LETIDIFGFQGSVAPRYGDRDVTYSISTKIQKPFSLKISFIDNLNEKAPGVKAKKQTFLLFTQLYLRLLAINRRDKVAADFTFRYKPPNTSKIINSSL
jgi:hypothetical protein